MDYEKKYKEALERASMLRLQNPYDTFSKLVEQIFPELEESEDEKMKRLIISTITLYWGDPLKDYTKGKQLINWIEKQWGNNIKPTEKFKRDYGNWDYDEQPDKKKDIKRNIEEINKELVDAANEISLKVGDWIISKFWKNPLLLKGVTDGYYSYEDVKGNIISPCAPPLIDECHIWSIQDAKDGDILIHEDKPFIFKGLVDTNHPNCPVAYCGIDERDIFIVGSRANNNTYWWCSYRNVKPATKEQCDFLFQEMNEANYRWDDKKKELISIK